MTATRHRVVVKEVRRRVSRNDQFLRVANSRAQSPVAATEDTRAGPATTGRRSPGWSGRVRRWSTRPPRQSGSASADLRREWRAVSTLVVAGVRPTRFEHLHFGPLDEEVRFHLDAHVGRLATAPAAAPSPGSTRQAGPDRLVGSGGRGELEPDPATPLDRVRQVGKRDCAQFHTRWEVGRCVV